jgi:hypothetical protein
MLHTYMPRMLSDPVRRTDENEWYRMTEGNGKQPILPDTGGLLLLQGLHHKTMIFRIASISRARANVLMASSRRQFASTPATTSGKPLSPLNSFAQAWYNMYVQTYVVVKWVWLACRDERLHLLWSVSYCTHGSCACNNNLYAFTTVLVPVQPDTRLSWQWV